MVEKEDKNIAIVGVGVIAPNSKNATEFWRNIITGKDDITEIPPNRWLINEYFNTDPNAEDQVYSKHGSFIGDIPFDAFEFGIPPTNIEVTDTTQLLALIAAKEVLQDTCGGEYANIDLQRASVILGVTSAQELLISMGARIQKPIWRKALKNIGLSEEQIETVCQSIANQYVKWNENTFPGLLGNVVSGRIANRFNFGGTNCVTDAACASSFSALSMAIDELHLKRSDLVVAGGADTLNDIFMYMCFAKTKALSFKGKCSPFSEDADGTLLGEAICLFALKRLSDAERDGDKIYAVIKGIGSSSDGRSKSIYAPLSSGQAKSSIRSYENAGYTPDTVELVEAHGTGTVTGDLEEFKGLKEVFEKSSSQKQWCALGSVKSQIGHTKAAAGAVGLFKIVMALRHKIFPPTINVTSPNPALDLDHSPFYLNTKARPWIKSKHATPRRASVNSFGFGGTNFHIAVEEYTQKEHLHGRFRTFESELIILTGQNKQDILAQLNFLANDTTLNLLNLARKTQLEFDSNKPVKLTFILNRNDNLQEKIKTLSAKLNDTSFKEDESTGIYYTETNEPKKFTVIFSDAKPALYMGEKLAMYFDQARNVWDELADIKLKDETTLQSLVFPPAPFTKDQWQQLENRLTEPAFRYPATAALAFSQWRLLAALGIKPDYLFGTHFGAFLSFAAASDMLLPDVIRLSIAYGKILKGDVMTSEEFMTFKNELTNFTTATLKTPLLSNEANNAITFLEKNMTQPSSFSDNQVNLTLLLGAHSLENETGLWKILAKLAVNGVPINFNALWQDYVSQMIPLPHQYSTSTVYITGSNYHKPYPPGEFSPSERQTPHTVPDENKIKNDLANWATEEEKHLEAIYQQFEEKISKDQEKWVSVITDKIREISEIAKTTLHIKNQMAETVTHHAATSTTKEFNNIFKLPDVSPIVSHVQSQKVIPISKPVAPVNIAPPPKQEDVLLLTTLTRIIAEKTGFDPAMIKAEMSLEGDLGIDSIKRVEILAALRKEAPNLAPADPNELAALNSIKDITQFFHTKTNASPNVAAPVTPIPTATTAAPATPPPAPSELAKPFIEIIAEKTGFDRAIIKPEMSLESDLGIDSIKRVEILAALRKTMPDLPNADPNDLASLNTIQEILNFFEQKKK